MIEGIKTDQKFFDYVSKKIACGPDPRFASIEKGIFKLIHEAFLVSNTTPSAGGVGVRVKMIGYGWMDESDGSTHRNHKFLHAVVSCRPHHLYPNESDVTEYFQALPMSMDAEVISTGRDARGVVEIVIQAK